MSMLSLHWKSLVVFMLLAFAAGAIGSLAMPDAWYAALAKPSFNPPNWIFAPVWTALFVLMALAAWRVYVRSGLHGAVILWAVQLACNALWSPLFFGLHSIVLALADVVLLLALVLATTIAFFARDRLAGLLMLPYVGWVSFATLLTLAIYRLNP
jgi:tryptophan-rich sensory protein